MITHGDCTSTPHLDHIMSREFPGPSHFCIMQDPLQVLYIFVEWFIECSKIWYTLLMIMSNIIIIMLNMVQNLPSVKKSRVMYGKDSC